MGSQINKSIEPSKRRRSVFLCVAWYEWISIIVLGIAVLFFCLHQNFDVKSPIANDVWGQFGDFIGGLLGTFVAYVSVKLLVKTLSTQNKSNDILTQSNNDMAKVYRSQQFDTNFKVLWNMYNSSTELYLVGDKTGKKSFPTIIENMQQFNQENKTNVIDAFNKVFYIPHREVASVHFRTIYQIFSLITNSPIEEYEKTHYSKIMRSQFHEDELILLRYNCNCSYGRKMQKYVNQYNLLKHTPIMKLLEFDRWAVKLCSEQKNMIDTSFISWKKEIKNLILDVQDQDKIYSERISEKYTINFKINSYKNEFELKIEHSTKKKSNENTLDCVLDNFTDAEILSFMEAYLREVFICSNFELYNSLSDVLFTTDIITKKNDGMHIILVTLKKNDYPIIVSQQQLSIPTPIRSIM